MRAAHVAALAKATADSARQLRSDAHIADLKARLALEQMDRVDATVVDTPSQPTGSVGAAVQATQSVAPASLPSPSVNAQLSSTYTFTAVSEPSRGT